QQRVWILPVRPASPSDTIDVVAMPGACAVLAHTEAAVAEIAWLAAQQLRYHVEQPRIQQHLTQRWNAEQVAVARTYRTLGAWLDRNEATLLELLDRLQGDIAQVRDFALVEELLDDRISPLPQAHGIDRWKGLALLAGSGHRVSDGEKKNGLRCGTSWA